MGALALAAALGAPKHAVLGRKISPMLCATDESAGKLLAAPGYLFELKLDGVRIVADKQGSDVALTYRKVRDATASYPEIAAALRALDEPRVVLDGEIIAFDAQGRPDFELLGRRIHAAGGDAHRASLAVPVVYVVFDILAIGDYDLRGLPIEARKAILERLMPEAARTGGALRIHPTFESGTELFKLCREQRLEGVVAKKLGSTYRSGDRSPFWVKVKVALDADFVVVSWTEGEGKRERLGALDVATYENGRLVVRGRVGSGLDEATIDLLLPRLRAMAVPGPVAIGKYSPGKIRHHVRPEIVVSVRYMSFSTEGSLRHPVYRGERADVSPEDCTLRPSDVAAPATLEAWPSEVDDAAPSQAPRTSEPPRLHLSGLDAPALADGTTRRDVVAYYERVAPRLLPWLARRPCALVRYDVRSRTTSVIWPLPKWTPSWVTTMALRVGAQETRGVVVDDVDTLRFMVEAGGYTVNVGPFRKDHGNETDFLAFRLTTEGGDRAPVVALALHLRAILAQLGLPSFVKGCGPELDVLAPAGGAPREAAHTLAEIVARVARGDGPARIEPREMLVAPWALAHPQRGGPTWPISWDALENAPDVDMGLEAEPPDDPMRELLEAKVDLGAAVAALEPLVLALATTS